MLHRFQTSSDESSGRLASPSSEAATKKHLPRLTATRGCPVEPRHASAQRRRSFGTYFLVSVVVSTVFKKNIVGLTVNNAEYDTGWFIGVETGHAHVSTAKLSLVYATNTQT